MIVISSASSRLLPLFAEASPWTRGAYLVPTLQCRTNHCSGTRARDGKHKRPCVTPCPAVPLPKICDGGLPTTFGCTRRSLGPCPPPPDYKYKYRRSALLLLLLSLQHHTGAASAPSMPRDIESSAAKVLFFSKRRVTTFSCAAGRRASVTDAVTGTVRGHRTAAAARQEEEGHG